MRRQGDQVGWDWATAGSTAGLPDSQILMLYRRIEKDDVETICLPINECLGGTSVQLGQMRLMPDNAWVATWTQADEKESQEMLDDTHSAVRSRGYGMRDGNRHQKMTGPTPSHV